MTWSRGDDRRAGAVKVEEAGRGHDSIASGTPSIHGHGPSGSRQATSQSAQRGQRGQSAQSIARDESRQAPDGSQPIGVRYAGVLWESRGTGSRLAARAGWGVYW